MPSRRSFARALARALGVEVAAGVLPGRRDALVGVDRHAHLAASRQIWATTPSSSVARSTSATEVTPCEHLAGAVGAQRVHALLGRLSLDRLRVDVLGDQRADVVVDQHQLEDARGGRGSRCSCSPRSPRRGRSAPGRSGGRTPISASSSRRGLVGDAAVRAEHAHQALRQHGDQRRGDQEGLDAHVDQARDRARRRRWCAASRTPGGR